MLNTKFDLKTWNRDGHDDESLPIVCAHTNTHDVYPFESESFKNVLETTITLRNIFGQGFTFLQPFVCHQFAVYFSGIVTWKARGCWRFVVVVVFIVCRH